MRVSDSESSAHPLIVDSGEKARYEFWKDHTEALPRELLEITEWLSRAPGREVLTATAEGRERTRAAYAANVLFRVPAAGPDRKRWEEVIEYLRWAHARRRQTEACLARACDDLNAAEAALSASMDEIDTAKKNAERARGRLSDAEVISKEYLEALNARRIAGREAPTLRELTQARRMVRRCHELEAVADSKDCVHQAALNLGQARRRECEQRVLRARAEVQMLVDESAPRVRTGIWTFVNSWLDLQVLSVGTVASDEFRRRPRGESTRVQELEVPIDRDEP